jgi:alpha-amylase
MAKKQIVDPKKKKEAQQFLARVPDDCVFYCHDGRVLKNMNELGDALAAMSDETFAYHSNAEKKDFSKWISDVIGDKKLAKDLEQVSDRNLATRLVTTRIVTLKNLSA